LEIAVLQKSNKKVESIVSSNQKQRFFGLESRNQEYDIQKYTGIVLEDIP
jgi:hypothetical protein